VFHFLRCRHAPPPCPADRSAASPAESHHGLMLGALRDAAAVGIPCTAAILPLRRSTASPKTWTLPAGRRPPAQGASKQVESASRATGLTARELLHAASSVSRVELDRNVPPRRSYRELVPERSNSRWPTDCRISRQGPKMDRKAGEGNFGVFLCAFAPLREILPRSENPRAKNGCDLRAQGSIRRRMR